MTRKTENRTMLTDVYQLTMGAVYFDNNKNDKAVFDMFIRNLPKDWGFFIADGIEDAIDYSTNIKFENDDLEFLAQKGFAPNFLDGLKDFRFTGDIYAVREGTPIAPDTPILRVEAPRTEAQFLESMILNTVNFQTLIATKANRVVRAASPAAVFDFGLRRAQEMDAAMKGARATYIGGVVTTSTVLAGKEYNIPIKGTHAHSLVMSFPTELEAFRAYVKTFPETPTLLIDTYNVINGAQNAIIVAKEMEKKGKRLGAVRLDSGDLAGDSRAVRDLFDKADLSYVKIVVSNDLNEYKITDLIARGAMIDAYGVGTEMITAKPIAAIAGVYKIVNDESGAKIKLSSEKKSYPGLKQVYRSSDEAGIYQFDTLALESEKVLGIPLLEKIVANGKRVVPRRELGEIRSYCLSEVAKMPEHAKRLVANPYEVKISPGLGDLTDRLTLQYAHGGAK